MPRSIAVPGGIHHPKYCFPVVRHCGIGRPRDLGPLTCLGAIPADTHNPIICRFRRTLRRPKHDVGSLTGRLCRHHRRQTEPGRGESY